MEDKDNIRYNEVINLISSKKKDLNYDEEDEKLIQKLFFSYHKKIKGISRSSSEALAGAVVWLYSKLNFKFEHDKKWSREGIGEIFNANKKTVGNKASEIHDVLKIKIFDDRFSKKEIRDKNLFNEFVMLENGMIIPRKEAIKEDLFFASLKKTKEDYFYEGQEDISRNDEKAIRCFKKALELDEEYIDAYNGLGSVYFWTNSTKAKEYYQKAYDLTLKHFKGKLPEKIEWGILENRQYLRAMHCFGLMLWKESKNEEAMKIFKSILKLNKNDNQGIRYLIAALYEGLSWEKMPDLDDKADELEKLFEKQNKIHKFFEWKNE